MIKRDDKVIAAIAEAAAYEDKTVFEVIEQLGVRFYDLKREGLFGDGLTQERNGYEPEIVEVYLAAKDWDMSVYDVLDEAEDIFKAMRDEGTLDEFIESVVWSDED